MCFVIDLVCIYVPKYCCLYDCDWMFCVCYHIWLEKHLIKLSCLCPFYINHHWRLSSSSRPKKNQFFSHRWSFILVFLIYCSHRPSFDHSLRRFVTPIFSHNFLFLCGKFIDNPFSIVLHIFFCLLLHKFILEMLFP